MDQAMNLTLEQEFNLRQFTDQVQQMSREQAQELLTEQHKLMMIRESMYREILKHEWKIGADFAAI